MSKQDTDPRQHKYQVDDEVIWISSSYTALYGAEYHARIVKLNPTRVLIRVLSGEYADDEKWVTYSRIHQVVTSGSKIILARVGQQ